MKQLLAAIDFSPGTDLVLQSAAKMARREGARLHLLHVAPPQPDFVPYEAGPHVVRDQVAEQLRQEHRLLHQLAAGLQQQGLVVGAHMVQGPTVETILQWAAKDQVDCIILGSHGHGALRRLVLGSVSEGVIRGAQCPVLVVPACVSK